jgi:hypothetical protein
MSVDKRLGTDPGIFDIQSLQRGRERGRNSGECGILQSKLRSCFQNVGRDMVLLHQGR